MAKTPGFQGRAFHKKGSQEPPGGPVLPVWGRATGWHSSRTLWVKMPVGPQGQAVTQTRALFLASLTPLPAEDLSQERTTTAMVHV